MSEMALGWFNPFGPPGKITVHEYKKWQSLYADFRGAFGFGGPDGTMNFWVVYEGYIYYGNSPEQLAKLRKILDYRQSCSEVLTMNVKKWNEKVFIPRE